MKMITKLFCVILCVLMMMAFVSCGDMKSAANADGKTEGNTEPIGNESNVELTESVEEAETLPEEPAVEEKAPATAKELWTMIDEKMESLDSYESDAKLTAVMFMEGFKFELSTKGYIVLVKDSYYYEYYDSEMLCDEMSYESASIHLEAYNEGTAYYSEITDGIGQSFCSEMSFAEFEEYAMTGPTDEFEFDDCTKAEFSKVDGEGWTITFSGYTKKAISGFLKSVGMEKETLGADVLDLNISIVANSDYTVKELELALVFDVEEYDTAVPVLVETMKYSNFNSAKPVKDAIDTDDYVAVDDFRVISKVDDAIEAYCEKTESNFVLDIKNTVTADGQTGSTTEKNTVSFGKRNGAYYYLIDVTSNNINGTVSYKNGVQTITVGEDMESAPQSEEYAEAFVYSLFNNADYNSVRVTAVEKISENVYSLEVIPSENLLDKLIASADADVKDSKQTIVVTFKGDELAKIESKLKVTAEYSENGNTMMADLELLTTVNVGETGGLQQNF